MILVHGDPAFQKLGGTFHRVEDLRCEIRYTGFVQQEQPVLTNQWPSSEPSIVASIGSGRYRQGQLLLESIIGAAAILKQELPHCFRIFAGPFIPEDFWEHLIRLAHHVTNVQIKKYSPEFPGFLKHADLSISMGGYNTMMNILATRIRSLVYPYTANDDQEQQIRARRLESLGVVELLHPNLLAPEILARKIAAILAKEPTKQQFDMDGAPNTARILLGAVSSRRNSVNEVGG
jgi:predicted glycosyltransferase